MPVYEYECTGCGRMFELRRSMTGEDAGVRCPECGAESPRRLFSTFGVVGSSSNLSEQASCESCSSGDRFT